MNEKSQETKCHTKRFNPLGLLSLLMVLSVLGLLTENKGFFGFVGFAAYLRYFRVIPDEGFWENVKHASTIAFLLQVLLLIPTMVASYFFIDIENFVALALATCFTAAFITFSIALVYFEWKENQA